MSAFTSDDGEHFSSVRWNGDDDVVPVQMMVKTAVEIATKNLAVLGGESLTWARSHANCDQAGVKPAEKGSLPAANRASSPDAQSGQGLNLSQSGLSDRRKSLAFLASSRKPDGENRFDIIGARFRNPSMTFGDFANNIQAQAQARMTWIDRGPF